ncbi:MAG: hypothetical protein P8010_21625 [Desulfosarcinaceae bacterium]
MRRQITPATAGATIMGRSRRRRKPAAPATGRANGRARRRAATSPSPTWRLTVVTAKSSITPRLFSNRGSLQ